MVWTDRSLVQAAGHMLSEGGADIHPAGQDLLDGSGQLFWRGLFGEIGLSTRLEGANCVLLLGVQTLVSALLLFRTPRLGA